MEKLMRSSFTKFDKASGSEYIFVDKQNLIDDKETTWMQLQNWSD